MPYKDPEKQKASNARAYQKRKANPVKTRRDSAKKKRYHDQDREKWRAWKKAWYQENFWQAKDRDLRRKFGISLEYYNCLLEKQGGVCACCKQKETATQNKKPRALCVDHHHGSGKVRGLLCTACNTSLGALGEDPVRMRRLIDYAIEHLDCPLEQRIAKVLAK